MNSLDHLVELIEQNPFIGAVTTPSGQSAPISYAPPTQAQLMQERLAAHNVELPFTAYDKRRIWENMVWTESIMAVKSSDRLGALQMLGKAESVNVFAAEKRVVEITDTSVLKSRIEEKLSRLLSQVDDAEIIE